jgi:hypothetical protein
MKTLEEDEKIDIKSYEVMIGKKWFFRTVTYHMVGRVTGIVGGMFVLEDATWIADSGRFNEFLKTGRPAEAEPVGDCQVNIHTIVDCFPFEHDLNIGVV